MATIGALESLFNKLGELKANARKGQGIVVMRASSCAPAGAQAAALTQNIDLVLQRMIGPAKAECYRLNNLDYAFFFEDSAEAAREFVPNVRVALFKVLSKLGAGQNPSKGGGLIFDHYKLDKDFPELVRVVMVYIKTAKSVALGQVSPTGERFLTESDLKAVIEAYRKVGPEKFLKTFARSQPICVVPERGPLKTKMTEFFINIDLLRKPFFEGVDLSENGDRFAELTKILDSIMLNSFETVMKSLKGQPVSINLNIPSIFSKAFENFVAKTPEDVMRNVVVEFRQDDAVLNYDGYVIARDHLRAKGAQIAIDQISPSSIGLVNIGFLEAQIAKLQWNPDAAEDLYEGRSILEKLKQSGVQPILSRVDDETAREVGEDLGIEMYQGFLIDNMIKAEAAAA